MSDRIAIVTGTSAGIGEAVARGLLARGWRVVGMARRASELVHPAYQHIMFDLARVVDEHADLERQLAPLVGDPACRRIGLVNNAAAAEGLMPVAKLEPSMLARTHAVNVIAPMWLMGVVMRASPPDAALRIVNVSSGAATTGFPGLAAYGSAKAALRLAGMSLASELESSSKTHAARRDAAILSYEPGVVETDMQRYARSRSPQEFPWVSMFHEFAERGLLVPAERPAAEIVAFLESDGQPAFTERRLRS
jgi:benzil reductase ((S)-benzoin forming)